jgi:hypothetical protein
MLSEYEIFAHLPKKGFMSIYLLWHQHEEVQAPLADGSDGNNDADRMDDMVADIGWGYVLESMDPPLEVQNFYKLLAASEEKLHDGTDVIVQVHTLFLSKEIAKQMRWHKEGKHDNKYINILSHLLALIKHRFHAPTCRVNV